MLHSHIDHIVITASSLAAGSEYIFRTLGVALESGGEHSRMGTHNLLLRLGKDVYIEVIAINPEAQQPDRPSWFGLTSDYNQPTGLAGWVARTNDITAASQAATLPLGPVETMTRGQLSWQITIPDDGRLVMNGAAPALIQWDGTQHPASRMEDIGCTLISLEAFHPDAADVRQLLEQIGFEGPFTVSPLEAGQAPYLIVHIHTPSGPKQIDSRHASKG
ncbi:VOC family protein [Pollutimonas harenae]|uniref:VOC family protein n=1 Tax=Pollutimonas harenae TaxID=657015 RepID=A0A853H0R1_9BURK|nr:VOC family protein [Pollutimonas harenae]NYT85319.1 VOC family protein [Pollutimonas harenae]TEA70423.1 VOC family protein [Pollutimonas harenae]